MVLFGDRTAERGVTGGAFFFGLEKNLLRKTTLQQHSLFDETSKTKALLNEEGLYDAAVWHWSTLRNIIRSFKPYIIRDGEYEGECQSDFYFHFKPFFNITNYIPKDPEAAYLYIVKVSYAGVRNAEILSANVKIWGKEKEQRKDIVYNIFLDVLIPKLELKIDYYILPDVQPVTIANEKRRMKPGTFSIILTDVEFDIATEITKIDEKTVEKYQPFVGFKQYFRNLHLDIEYSVDEITCIDDNVIVPQRSDGKSYFELDERNIDKKNICNVVKMIIENLSENISTEYHNIKEQFIAAIKAKIYSMKFLSDIPDIVKDFFCYRQSNQSNVAKSSNEAPASTSDSSSDSPENNLVTYFADEVINAGKAYEYIKEQRLSGEDNITSIETSYLLGLFAKAIDGEAINYGKWDEHLHTTKSKISDFIDISKDSGKNAFDWKYYNQEMESLEMTKARRNKREDALYHKAEAEDSYLHTYETIPHLNSWITLWDVIQLFDCYEGFNKSLIKYKKYKDKIIKSDNFTVHIGENQKYSYHFGNIEYSGFDLSKIRIKLNPKFAQESVEPLPLPDNPETKKIRSDTEFLIDAQITIPELLIETYYYQDEPLMEDEYGLLTIKVTNLEINALIMVRKIDPQFVHTIDQTNKKFHFRLPQVLKFRYTVEKYDIIRNETYKDEENVLQNRFENIIEKLLSNPDDELFKSQAEYLQKKLGQNIIPMPSIYNIYDVLIFTLFNEDINIKYRYNTPKENREARRQFLKPIRRGSSALKHIKRTLRDGRQYFSFRDILTLRDATLHNDLSSHGGDFDEVMKIIRENREREREEVEEETQQAEEEMEQNDEVMGQEDEDTRQDDEHTELNHVDTKQDDADLKQSIEERKPEQEGTTIKKDEIRGAENTNEGDKDTIV